MGKTRDTGFLTDCVFTDSSNNVGIGAAASGSYKLQVTGTTNLTGALSGTSATFSGNSFLATSSGDVGIGTSTPNLTAANRKVIDINGTTESLISFSSGGTNKSYIFNDGTNLIMQGATLKFQTGYTDRLTIASTGAATFSSSIAATSATFSDQLTASTSRVNGRLFTTSDASFGDMLSTTGVLAISYDAAGQTGYITSRNYTTSTNTPLVFTSSAATFSNQVTINGPSADWAAVIQNTNSTSGTSYGLKVKAGTSGASDATFVLQDYAGNEFFTARGNGRIGIGTSTLNYAKFNVYNNTNDPTYSAKIQAVFGNSDYLDSDASNNFGGGLSETQFLNGAANRPAMLSLGGSLNTGESMGVINFFRSGNTDGYRARVQISGNVKTTGTANQHGGYLSFLIADDGQANPSEKLLITSGGFTKASNNGSFVGSTAIYHELRTNQNARIAILSNGSGTLTEQNGILVYFSSASPMNTTSSFIDCEDSTTLRFSVKSNGNVQNWFNSYGALSDIKLKENVTDSSPKLDDLLKVKVRNYNLIGDETKQIGVIAQELEEIFPSMIDETEDFEKVEVTDEDGNVTTEKKSLGTTTKSVKYSVFVPMLIKAIQEQNEIITKQGQAIEELKALIAAK